MKRIVICFVCVLLLAGLSNAQTKSMTGTVIEILRGTYKWGGIVIRVDTKKYFVYTFSGSHPTPKTIGKVEEVGRTVQVFYSKIEKGTNDGDVIATKIVEVKKSNSSANEIDSNKCRLCGLWEYYDRESQSNYYLKIVGAGAGKFKLIPGFVGVGGQIAWQENEESGLMLTNGDGIYLRPVNGRLVGSFVSLNFRPTGGQARTYRITCEPKSNGKMAYTVASSGFIEKYEATKKD
ncbi:MAG TPA: hypothetical protein VJU86_01345 [Pyrinomonadaceae bacterium]|nr:hypothetical protein [Pyrinomonadaceae bacterium]